MFLPHRSLGQNQLGVLIAIPEPWVIQPTESRLNLGDLQGPRVPAYIAVLPPTSFPTGERPEVIRHLREVAKYHSPLHVTLKGSDSFRPLSQVTFLSLSEGAVECANFVDEVRTEPLDIEQRFPYHPYVTLAQGADDPVLDLALNPGANFETSWLVPGPRLDRVDENGMYPTMTLSDFEALST